MNVIAYMRYSSTNQDDGYSIEAQRRAIEEFCNRQGYKLINEFIDEAKTGTNDNREAFIDMIASAEDKTFEAVIVHKLDRFARNRYDSAFYKKKLKDNGVKLMSVLEHLDDSPESIILESVLEGMSEYYSKNLSREVKKGLKENALLCKHNGGIHPTGYDVSLDKSLVINEHEAQIVKKIFEMHNLGSSRLSIAKELNKLGYKTKTGNLFGVNSIRDIITNKKYVGTYVFGRKKQNPIEIENGCPAIVTKEVFEEAQKRLAANTPHKPKENKKNYYLLTGYCKCGLCGSAYTGSSSVPGRNGKRYSIYGCTKRSSRKGCDNKNIRQLLLESEVLDIIKREIFSDDAIEEIIIKMKQYIKDLSGSSKEDLERLNELSVKLEKKIDRVYELYMDEEISKEEFKSKTAPIREELEGYKYKIEELKNASVIEEVDEDMIRYFLIQSRENIYNEDVKIKRKVIETFLNKVVIFPEYIEVYLNIGIPNGKKCIQPGRGEGEESHHFGLILLFTIDKSELFLKYNKSSMSALV